jgi:hypothetical protein
VLFVVAAFAGFSGHFVQKFAGKKSASGAAVLRPQGAQVAHPLSLCKAGAPQVGFQ